MSNILRSFYLKNQTEETKFSVLKENDSAPINTRSKVKYKESLNILCSSRFWLFPHYL